MISSSAAVFDGEDDGACCWTTVSVFTMLAVAGFKLDTEKEWVSGGWREERAACFQLNQLKPPSTPFALPK